MHDGVPQILLLEDDSLFASALEQDINHEFGGRVEVWLAANLEEAIQLFREQEKILDAVVTDIMMPNGEPGGLDLVSLVAGRIPVIVMTAHEATRYVDNVEKFGPVVFLDKNDRKSSQTVVRNVRSVVSWKTVDERLGPQDREMKHLCLSRNKGAILAIHFHLAPVDEGSFIDSDITNWDFASLSIGFKCWQQEAEAREGRLCSFSGQSKLLVFEDTEEINSFKQAVESARAASQLDNQGDSVFYRCPFSAAVLTGINVTGIFGRRVPGYPAVVGRREYFARQITQAGEYGETAIVPTWLQEDEYKWVSALPGQRRRSMLSLMGLTSPVDVEFIRF